MPCQSTSRSSSTVMAAWRRPKPSLSVLLLIVCLLCPVLSQDQRLATFYGAYQRIKPSSTDTVVLNFKSSTPTGLILAVRLDRNNDKSNAGYLAVGISNRHLVTVISENSITMTNISTDFTLKTEQWYTLAVHLNTNITVDLTGKDVSYSSNHSLSPQLTVKDAFLGGANSFFSRAFMTLHITEYFTGCLANCSINDRDINFAPKVAGYGMEYGCCPNPEPIMWRFGSGLQNSFSFTHRLIHTRFRTDKLTLSFNIQATQDGMVFYSHDSQDENIVFALAVELYNGHVDVYLANEADHYAAHSLSCEGSVTDGWWHEVSITIRQHVLECSVDGAGSRVNVSYTMPAPSSIQYYIGSAEVPPITNNLVLFQASLHSIGDRGMYLSFSGCLQNFQLNGLDVSPTSLASFPPSLSAACPVVSSSSTCQQLQEELSIAQIAQISVSVTNVSVDEHSTTTLTEGELILHLPENVAQLDIEEAVASTIQFNVTSTPSHGVLINVTNPSQLIEQFSYSDVLNLTVAYRHNGEEVASDSVHLSVRSSCSGVVSQNLVINFSVHLINDFPVVTRQGTISIAVGTRRVITADMISVEDEESTSLINISFRVLSIYVDGCNPCVAAGRIEQTFSPGFNSSDFNQMDIDRGDVAFQHFVEFGTSPITIHLRVSDISGASIEIELHVAPYVGHLNLTRNEPLPIIEGRCDFISSQHLHAATDFDNQNPILQYSITGAPEHGHLEIQDQGFWRPVLGPNIAFEGFTQYDVNHNLVRYCHDNHSLETDVFQFQLHSTHLVADSGNFTINVFPYADLQQPTVSLTTRSLSVPEGGQVRLTSNTLTASLLRNVRPPWSRKKIRIEHLGIFFHLENHPSFGEILLNGESLARSGFTHDELLEGVVTYRHDDSENHVDFVSVRIEATNSPHLPIKEPLLPPIANVSVHIEPINDNSPSIGTSPLRPSEGRFLIIRPDILNITDIDLPPQTITVTLLNQDADYGFFALSDTATPILNFTTDDIHAHRLYFHHRLEPSLPLNYTLEVLASDGERDSQESIRIEAVPLTISTSQVAAGECVANLDALAQVLSAQISPALFHDIEILDAHGKYNNRLQHMKLRVVRYPEHGQLLLLDATASTFTLNDVTSEGLRYHFLNRTSPVSADYFTVEITYGHSDPVNLTLKICIDPVPVPVQEAINAISLATDASVLIYNDTFRAVDSRGRGGAAVTYVILHPPQWGRVVNQYNNTLVNFSQADIDESRVFYQHLNRSSNTLKDYFVFKLCTEYVCKGEYNVTVTFSVTNLTVYNHGLTVDEGGLAYITKDHLDAIAPQGGVQFHIIRPPMEGTLCYRVGGYDYQISQFFETRYIASHSVWYNHSGSETLRDSFTFSATAANPNEHKSGVFSITINPINNNLPRLVSKEVHMIARTTRNISSEDLFAYDVDSDADSQNLRYSVSVRPSHGRFHYRNDTSLRPLSQWFEREIRSGQIAYTHTSQDKVGDDLRDLIGITLFDRTQPNNQIISIHISEIQINVDQSRLGFEVMEGGEGTIDESHLYVTADGDDALTDVDLKFVLTSFPRNGVLTLRGLAVTNFTQADLAFPGLVYLHDHSNTVTDNFTFNVMIPQHDATEPGIFKITIKAIDDDPPSLTFLLKPLFVIEGETTIINREHLQVYDFDTDMSLFSQTNEIEFRIISQPSHGAVKRHTAESSKFKVTDKFTLYDINHSNVLFERYLYDMTVENRWCDSFLVNLTDGHNMHDTPYNFSFIVLPDVVTVEATPFTVPEGESVILPNETIVALHPFLSTQPGLIMITEPPKNGSLYNSATDEMNITNFTTSDLARGHIEYYHNGAEEGKDKLKFTYEAHQPGDTQYDSSTQPGGFPNTFRRTSDVEVLEILVDTVNDRGPEVRSDPDKTLVMWAEDCAFLTVRYLDVFDADTPANKLIYTFNFTFDAHISYINVSNNVEIDYFTQEDVINSIIKLFHHGGVMGTMYYTVTDGQFTVSSQLNIETHRVEIVVVHNNPLSVAMNGMVHITSDVLNVSRSDENSTRCRLIEFVEYRYQAKYGVIIVDGVPAKSFTQEDVDEERVVYQHTRPELWESLEKLQLKANATLTKVKDIGLNITINLPSEPNSPLAVHKSLMVKEGGRACLNESILDARNIRYDATKETFNANLTSWFVFELTEDSHGEILVDGIPPPETGVTQDQIANGSVCYRNFGDESPVDPLDFSVHIRDSGKFLREAVTDLVFDIFVTLINDESPVVTSSSLMVPIVEGFSAHIDNESLLITDEDNPASDLIYTILNVPSGGQLWWSNHQLQENDNFSQAIVDDGALRFQALGVGEWTTLLSFTDGKYFNQTYFTVTMAEHKVKLEDTEVLRYSQNEKGTQLTPKHIIIQTNGNPNETMYYVIEEPRNGYLKGLNDQGGFSQIDLKAGNVCYIPTDFNSHSDSFTLNITNREAITEEPNVTIQVRVDVWGQVKQDVELDFDSVRESSVPLPKNLLKLNDLQLHIQRPPCIKIIQEPKLGFLEVKIPSSVRSQRSASREFYYNYLDYNWVYYTWNSSIVSTNPQGYVNDSFSVLVEGYQSIQPGEATINLYIKNPPVESSVLSPNTEAPTSSGRTVDPVSIEDNPSSSGFPNYALLPILGVFVFLLVIIIVVTVFCITQQGRIRKRWQPRMPRHHLAARGQNFLLHATSNMYDLEPTTQAEAMTTLTEMVDRGSEFRDGRSPLSHSPLSRYSPSASHPPSAMYQPAEVGQQTYHHRHMIPRPRSRRSNVSVSYSHRLLSEITLDDIPRSRHHTFSPPPISHYATPVPVGPMTESSSVYEGEGESGYLSTLNPSVIADEPVRLVLRQPKVEEVPPLPQEMAVEEVPPLPQETEETREVEEGDEEGFGEEGGEEVGETSENRGEDQFMGSNTEVCDRFQVESNSNEPRGLIQQALEQLQLVSAEEPASNCEEPSSHDQAAASPSSAEQALHSSNGAHAVSTPPSESEAPPALAGAAASASSSTTQQNTTTSSSDLHALFRTHNPILKHTEYWV